jgi:uncharacterized RDD family membrane protein YckC
MKTWGIKLVDVAGKPLTQARALLRYVLCWVWFLPALAALSPLRLPAMQSVVITLAWVAFWALLSRLHPQRQFWHDALAGTRLISVPRPTKRGVRSGNR